MFTLTRGPYEQVTTLFHPFRIVAIYQIPEWSDLQESPKLLTKGGDIRAAFRLGTSFSRDCNFDRGVVETPAKIVTA